MVDYLADSLFVLISLFAVSAFVVVILGEGKVTKIRKYILGIDKEMTLEECKYLEKRLKTEFDKIKFSNFVFEKHEIERMSNKSEEKENYILFKCNVTFVSKVFSFVNGESEISVKLNAK